MTFTYKLNGTGWAKGRLQIDEQILEFEVSYLGDPLAELLEGIVEITPGYASTLDGIPDTDTNFIWKGEPWGYKWNLKFISFDNLQIKVFHIDDIFDESNQEQICFESNCNYYDFVGAIIDELTILLNTHGLVGYYQTWAGRLNFPVAEFLKLKYFIKSKNVLDTIIIEPINPEFTDNWTQATTLEHELNLLINNKL